MEVLQHPELEDVFYWRQTTKKFWMDAVLCICHVSFPSLSEDQGNPAGLRIRMLQVRITETSEGLIVLLNVMCPIPPGNIHTHPSSFAELLWVSRG